MGCLAEEDVNMAVQMAEEVVRWNGAYYNKGEKNNKLKDIIYNFHTTYNDITIISLSGFMIGVTVMINNKSGEIWISDLTGLHPDFSITAATKDIKSILKNPPISQSKHKPNAAAKNYTMGFSINFGSVVGGKKTPDEINKIIQKSAVGYQVCHIACAGLMRTQGKKEILLSLMVLAVHKLVQLQGRW